MKKIIHIIHGMPTVCSACGLTANVARIVCKRKNPPASGEAFGGVEFTRACPEGHETRLSGEEVMFANDHVATLPSIADTLRGS